MELGMLVLTSCMWSFGQVIISGTTNGLSRLSKLIIFQSLLPQNVTTSFRLNFLGEWDTSTCHQKCCFKQFFLLAQIFLEIICWTKGRKHATIIVTSILMYIFSLILHVVEKYSSETWPYEGVTSFQHCKLNRGAESYFTVQYDRDLRLTTFTSFRTKDIQERQQQCFYSSFLFQTDEWLEPKFISPL